MQRGRLSVKRRFPGPCHKVACTQPSIKNLKLEADTINALQGEQLRDFAQAMPSLQAMSFATAGNCSTYQRSDREYLTVDRKCTFRAT